jgi:hypothetical protein
MSGDGATLVVANSSSLFVANAAGWVRARVPALPYSSSLSSPQGYTKIAISANGGCIYAGGIGSTGQNKIWGSTDAGKTWREPSGTPYGFSNTQWTAVLTTSDGTGVLAVPAAGSQKVFWSADSGATFFEKGASLGYDFYTSAAMSADGSKWVAGVSKTAAGSATTYSVIATANYGTDWTLVTGAPTDLVPIGMACDALCNYLFVGLQGRQSQ